MAYTKQTWQDLPSKTTPINASRLGHMEDGIYDAAQTADNASSAAASAVAGLDDKVDKVTGKGLSTNDFTDTLKTKLDNIESGAQVNVQADWDEDDTTADSYIANKPTLGTAATKNSTSVVTQSTDLVESGAVYDVVKGSVGFVTTGKNLLEAIIQGSMSTYGIVNPATNNRVSNNDYIPVNGGATYTISSSANVQVIVLEFSSIGSERIYQSSWSDVPYTFTTQSGTRYVKMMFRYSNDANITPSDVVNPQMEVGSEATAFEPYHVSVEDTLRDAEVVEGKNLLNPDVIKNTTRQYVPIYVGDGDFTLSSTCPQASGGLACIFLLAGNVQTGGSSANDGVWDGQPRTVTAVDGYITVSSRNEGGINPKLYNTQLEKGSTATSYEPYYIPLKDVVPNKADNSVIAPIENGTNASKAYAVGSHAIRNGAFITWKNAKAQDETINDVSDYISGAVGDYIDVTYKTSEAIEVTANNYSNVIDIPTINGYTPFHVNVAFAGSGAAMYSTYVTTYNDTTNALSGFRLRNTDSSNHSWNILVNIHYIKTKIVQTL